MDYKDPQKSENNSFANWPDCAIDGCPNKCCLALDSVFCFPHTPGNKHVKHMKIDALNCDPVDEPADGTRDMLTAIEAYHFECEAGPLKNCAEWIELKKRLGV